ncbi:MAG: hypothetical protein KH436_03760 [Firmicutes bacterium]|nr:hypothetical protein [Bacillota bacterium]
MQNRDLIVKKHLQNGVLIVDPHSVWIDPSVHIAAGVVIHPNNTILGDTEIAEGVVLEPNNQIENSVIGARVRINSSVVRDSAIASDTAVGPFAHIRGRSLIGKRCRIGNFVELKNAELGEGVKVAHLSYIGDATVGEHTNVGCGVVFCNYDGKNKYHTFVGKRCFIGSNCNLIAPLRIGDGSFLAAGTTVHKDVEKGRFVIGRMRQEENAFLAEKYLGRKN